MKASSIDLVDAIAGVDFSADSVTVVGYGNMGRQYVGALRKLKVGQIFVCSRSPEPLSELKDIGGIEVADDGLAGLSRKPLKNELAIVSTPPEILIAASEKLLKLGYRRLLIERPVSLSAKEILKLSDSVDREGAQAVCGFNRLAFPSFIEVLARCDREGGITSFHYDFTELVRADWSDRFPPQELARWGVANSLHVLSMAHGLGGFPADWNGYRRGKLPWHPSGSIFVGSGISETGAAFSYHADWESKGRWTIEIETVESCYKLCPLERVFQKTSGTGEYTEVPVAVFAPDVKPGVLEQVAAMLDDNPGAHVPLMSLNGAARLTQFAHSVFGYPEE